jgi:hypothetical protein
MEAHVCNPSRSLSCAINDEYFIVTEHALKRAEKRAIGIKQLETVLEYGRVIHSRRARFYVIGKREVKALKHLGSEIRQLENIQVVVDDKTNSVLTAYRNRDFRQIRPTSRRERKLH